MKKFKRTRFQKPKEGT